MIMKTEKGQEKEINKTPQKESNFAKKVSKTLEAARRLKGNLIVNDPAFLL